MNTGRRSIFNLRTAISQNQFDSLLHACGDEEYLVSKTYQKDAHLSQISLFFFQSRFPYFLS
jgi:hypothetical protein